MHFFSLIRKASTAWPLSPPLFFLVSFAIEPEYQGAAVIVNDLPDAHWQSYKFPESSRGCTSAASTQAHHSQSGQSVLAKDIGLFG